MTTDEARTALQRAAVLWSVGARDLYDVVLAACDALVAGLDGDSLRMLAAMTRQEATGSTEVLADALHELGLEHHEQGSDGGVLAAVRVTAAELISGGVTPRELASWFHTAYAHGQHPAVDPFLELDDRYDLLEYSPEDTEEQLDALVVAETRRLLTEHPVGAGSVNTFSDGHTGEVGTHDR